VANNTSEKLKNEVRFWPRAGDEQARRNRQQFGKPGTETPIREFLGHWFRDAMLGKETTYLGEYLCR